MLEILCMFLYVAIPYTLVVSIVSAIGATFKSEKDETKK